MAFKGCNRMPNAIQIDRHGFPRDLDEAVRSVHLIFFTISASWIAGILFLRVLAHLLSIEQVLFSIALVQIHEQKC